MLENIKGDVILTKEEIKLIKTNKNRHNEYENKGDITHKTQVKPVELFTADWAPALLWPPHSTPLNSMTRNIYFSSSSSSTLPFIEYQIFSEERCDNPQKVLIHVCEMILFI